MRHAGLVGSLALVGLITGATAASAQAWVSPAHSGSVSFIVQSIDHTGRIRDDGSQITCCRVANVAFDVDVDYALTDRLSVSFGIPFVLAKYHDVPYNTGPGGFPPFREADACGCWNAGFQDVDVMARYNVLNVRRAFVLTPSVSLGMPSHGYDYSGEAVIGFGLKELRVAVDAGQRLDAILPGLSVQTRYSYAVVERVLDISHNRSNGSLDAHYVLTRHFSVRGMLPWQVTHGGLRMPVDVAPYPDRVLLFHSLLQDNYLHAGAGLSYFWSDWELSGSYSTAVRGSNTHTVHVFTMIVARQFELGGGG